MWASRGAPKVGPCLAGRPADEEELPGYEPCLAWSVGLGYAPAYEVLLFDFTTGAFLGPEHLLRPDIYQQGTPRCPQQPGGQYIYNPFNDLWFCDAFGFDPP